MSQSALMSQNRFDKSNQKRQTGAYCNPDSRGRAKSNTKGVSFGDRSLPSRPS